MQTRPSRSCALCINAMMLQAIKDSLRRVVEVMEEWQMIMAEKACATFREHPSSAATK